MYGGKGREQPPNYTVELAPKRPFGSVGVLRVRPLPRCRVMARREAAFREEAANQRWYRVNDALCPKGQGAFCYL